MTKEQIRTKFDRWAERVGHTPFENGLDNATLLLSYDDKQTSTTLSTVAVYAVAVHTDHVHVFLLSARTAWQLDERGKPAKCLMRGIGLLWRFNLPYSLHLVILNRNRKCAWHLCRRLLLTLRRFRNRVSAHFQPYL